METPTQHLYIVQDNPLEATNLMNFLKKRFNESLRISIFTDGESLLRKIDDQTAIVILDYDLKGERADKLLLDVKRINPSTEVIILSSDEEIGTAIDAYRKGAKSFVHKDTNGFRKIQAIVSRIVYYPVAIIQRFFGLKELFAIYVVEVIYIGLVVFIGMKFFT